MFERTNGTERESIIFTKREQEPNAANGFLFTTKIRHVLWNVYEFRMTSKRNVYQIGGERFGTEWTVHFEEPERMKREPNLFGSTEASTSQTSPIMPTCKFSHGDMMMFVIVSSGSTISGYQTGTHANWPS